MSDLTMVLRGTRPLLLHNVRLRDELDPFKQRLDLLTGKTKKTLDDHKDIADAEWLGGLYWDEDLGPYVKSECVDACFQKMGGFEKKGSAIKRGVVITGTNGSPDMLRLQYDGPRDIETLLADPNFRHRGAVNVGSGTKKLTMRTRPRFAGWSLECVAQINTSQIDLKDLKRIAAEAGTFIGLGDYRPRYGRFEVDFS
jgi:hypothetical protein